LLLHDEAIVLRAQGIDLENISITAIMGLVNQNFEVIVQVLTRIAPQFRRNDPGRFGVVAMNPKINGSPREENANLRFFRRRLAFVRLALAKISDGRGRLPQWVVEASIESWGVLNRCRLGHGWVFLGSGRERRGRRSSICIRGQSKQDKKNYAVREAAGTVKSLILHLMDWSIAT
jgi:hypothetical protein